MNPKSLIVFVDGGARGNPGPAAVGIVIHGGKPKPVEIKKFIGRATNNVAEYTAVLLSLEFIFKKFLIEKVEFKLDSELVVRQLNGQYKVKDSKLKLLYAKIRELIWGKTVSFSHVKREKNARADYLVNEALDEALERPEKLD